MTTSEAGKKGAAAFMKKYGSDKYSEMGKKGAEGKVRKYGKEYYSRIGKISAEKRRAAKEAKLKKENHLDNVSNFLSGKVK